MDVGLPPGGPLPCNLLCHRSAVCVRRGRVTGSWCRRPATSLAATAARSPRDGDGLPLSHDGHPRTSQVTQRTYDLFKYVYYIVYTQFTSRASGGRANVRVRTSRIHAAEVDCAPGYIVYQPARVILLLLRTSFKAYPIRADGRRFAPPLRAVSVRLRVVNQP